MKALVGTFKQEKALVGAFSVIVKTGCGTDGPIYSTSPDAVIVALARQNLTASVVVALHTASGASEVLNTISGGSKNIHSQNDILQ